MGPRRKRSEALKAKKPFHVVLADQHALFREKPPVPSGIEADRCVTCDVAFQTENDRIKHLTDPSHKQKEKYRVSRHSVKKYSVSGIEIRFVPDEVHLEVDKERKVDIFIRNTTLKDVTVLNYTELVRYNFKPGFKIYFSVADIPAGGEIKFLMVVGFGKERGAYSYPVIFSFLSGTGNKLIYCEPLFYCLNEAEDSSLLELLKPSSQYKSENKNFVHLVELPIIHAPNIKSIEFGLPKVVKLHNYFVPSVFFKLLNHKFDLSKFKDDLDRIKLVEAEQLLETFNEGKPNSKVLSRENYASRFAMLLYLEETQIRKDMLNFKMVGVKLFPAPTTGGHHLALQIPGLQDDRPSVLRGDSVYIILYSKNDVRFEGKVIHVNKDSIELIFNKKFYYFHKIGDEVDVDFEANRYCIQVAQRAVARGRESGWEFLFPSACKGTGLSTQLVLFNKKIQENPQQLQAVQNIMDGTSIPSPYILFGPPGTGKTVTLVEVISQIWHLPGKFNKILVCTPSNSAADSITRKLLKHIPANEILRLYSISRNFITVPPEIKQCANFDLKGNIKYLTLDQIEKYQIIVCTLITSSKLVTCGLGTRNHFSHIIIDECGQAMEPESVVPILGLACRKPSMLSIPSAKVILAGDPNQLGPVICSKVAAQMGLEISLLERLMKLDIYKKDMSNNYNPAVITKLVQNYRSHPAIIEIPNKLFYENELMAKGDLDIIQRAAGWAMLPNKNYPIIFHKVKGKEERESNSPSYFNRIEILTIMQYLKAMIRSKGNDGFSVTPDDIGIITPYRKQVEKLRKAVDKEKWEGLKIGSVEEFQGDERLVIIISTVRSRQEILSKDFVLCLGFLKNPKRLNVALTRAKALMIVVGDSDILQCDPNWKEFILNCYKNKGCIGMDKDSLKQDSDLEIDSLSTQLKLTNIKS